MPVQLITGPFAITEMLGALFKKSQSMQPAEETFIWADIEFTVRVKSINGKPLPTDGQLAMLRMTTDSKERA